MQGANHGATIAGSPPGPDRQAGWCSTAAPRRLSKAGRQANLANLRFARGVDFVRIVERRIVCPVVAEIVGHTRRMLPVTGKVA
jgi:hypothetical protein